MFILSDGGSIALDWYLDDEGGLPRRNKQRPILACVAGLNGGNNNCYLSSMIRKATE